MRVTLRNNLYGTQTAKAGAIVDLPDKIALGLINAKKADPYPPPAPPLTPVIPTKE
jgi:hypothetical protein